MKCQRSGYCCIKLDVIIVDDPALGLIEGNLIHKPFNQRCKHLQGNKPGEMSCSIHDEPWYEDTPCFRHGQIENSIDSPCRIGEGILTQDNLKGLLDPFMV